MLWPAAPFQAFAPVNRRTFLATTTSLAAAALWSSRATRVLGQNAKVTDYPFALGVAAGDPTPDGFVLWTRLAPKPLEGGGMPAEAFEVAWQVADDEQMTKVVRQGTTAATPDWAHSVHVEVDGLQPDRWYWYRFRAAGATSPLGRARTFPAANASPARMRFAFASCQHFEDGYYTAYEQMAREEHDFIAHLGDYIYEGVARNDRPRKHVGGELASLDDYRNRHAQYKTDEALQAAHRLFPWIVVWDDHEVDNNYAADISEETSVLPADFLKRRASAYQAYYEHMPLRRSSLPQGPNMQLYRKLSFGRLAEIFALDTRQYRTDQPCGDGGKTPCDAVYDPNATLLGAKQEQWLFGGLSASPAKWNVLAQQVMMGRVDRGVGDAVTYSMDQWPGYEMNRRRVLQTFAERKVSNPVVITGDIHSNWANNLVIDFDDVRGRSVATEFVGTSLSSGGDGTRTPRNLEQLYAENPFLKFHSAERGYISCEVTPKQWRGDYRAVEYVTKPGSPVVTRASFVVEDGRPELQKA